MAYGKVALLVDECRWFTVIESDGTYERRRVEDCGKATCKWSKKRTVVEPPQPSPQENQPKYCHLRVREERRLCRELTVLTTYGAGIVWYYKSSFPGHVTALIKELTSPDVETHLLLSMAYGQVFVNGNDVVGLNQLYYTHRVKDPVVLFPFPHRRVTESGNEHDEI
ncbi:hypothetical protein CIB48_g3815 [Xylaria polymorpha]|nr:hypothetical protein CIB48_g3815 [Xylaria polymorpha]